MKCVVSTEEESKMFCIDFEDTDLVGAGVYQPWLLIDHIDRVHSDVAGCPQGDYCGYFCGGRLEVPLFSNAYSSFPSLRITFDYIRTPGGGDSYQGIISNDCFEHDPHLLGNSMGVGSMVDGIGVALHGREEPYALLQTVSITA